MFFDGPGPDGLAWAQRLDALAAWPERLRAIGGPTIPGRRDAALDLHLFPDHLAEVCRVLTSQRTDRRLVHVHASENAAENADVLTRLGATHSDPRRCRPARRGTERPSARRPPQRRGSCPRRRRRCKRRPLPGSNLKLASGALPWTTLAADGIRLGLGTDGCSSSNDLDLWQTMRQTALLARLTSADPTAAPAVDIIRAATIDGARALGLGDLIGSLEVGKRADLILLDLDAPHLTPIHDLPALLVFAAGRGDVTGCICGRPPCRARSTEQSDRHQRPAPSGPRARTGRRRRSKGRVRCARPRT